MAWHGRPMLYRYERLTGRPGAHASEIPLRCFPHDTPIPLYAASWSERGEAREREFECTGCPVQPDRPAELPTPRLQGSQPPASLSPQSSVLASRTESEHRPLHPFPSTPLPFYISAYM